MSNDQIRSIIYTIRTGRQINFANYNISIESDVTPIDNFDFTLNVKRKRYKVDKKRLRTQFRNRIEFNLYSCVCACVSRSSR